MGKKAGGCLVVLVGASLVLTGCMHRAEPALPAPPPPAPPPPDLHALYEHAIEVAAVKRPSFVVDLTPITARSEIQLITLNKSTEPPVDGKARTTVQPIWTALPDELAAKCRARGGDPLLALEELLGMPPESTENAGDWQLSSFTVSTRRVFRPCASSPSITTARCSLEIAKANGSQADFVYHQTWQSYQLGTDKPGYPFTGMGWTYDWGPAAPDSHVGVSEYVVRAGTHLSKVTVQTPQQFCQGDDSADVTAPAASPPAAAPAPPAH
jgi:hypothetical protein